MSLMRETPQNALGHGEQKAFGLGRIHIQVQGPLQALKSKSHFRHLHNPLLYLQLLHQKGRSLHQMWCDVLSE